MFESNHTRRHGGSRGLRSLVTCALILAFASLAGAAEDSAPAVSLDNTEVRSLTSEIVGQEFRILVAKPFAPPQLPAKKYPVIYMLDADMSFPLVRQVALSLSSGFELPPVLLVAVGYAGGFREGMVRRNRDYTPTPDPAFMKHASRWVGGGPGTDESGGAPKFLRFLREELKPFIEAEYRADPEDSTIFGDSFGGLFAAYALFEAPDTFERYVLGSPSLWWNDGVVLEQEAVYAKSHDDLSARVFIGVGGHETSEHDEAQFERMPEPMRSEMQAVREEMGDAMGMLEAIEPFVAALRSRDYPSLELSLYVFPGETHSSVPPMTISRGLRTVFGTL